MKKKTIQVTRSEADFLCGTLMSVISGELSGNASDYSPQEMVSAWRRERKDYVSRRVKHYKALGMRRDPTEEARDELKSIDRDVRMLNRISRKLAA